MMMENVEEDTPKVVIVMPAYNAEKTILHTLSEVPPKFRENIIVVDDASRDGTVRIARHAGLTVFVHAKNRGYGGNQKTCYSRALEIGADIVVMVHPDHQYDATVIPEMIQPIIDGKADAVFGSRMLGGFVLEGGMPLYKYVANIFLTAFANIVFRRYLTEIHSGFRAYSRKYLESVRFMENSDDFVFDTEIIAQGMARNLHFREVPIVTRYFKEASSINFWRSVVYGFKILQVLMKYGLYQTGIWKCRQFEPNRLIIRESLKFSNFGQ
jgi:glycosyltransferase involved in cell wall biosynthesis